MVGKLGFQTLADIIENEGTLHNCNAYKIINSSRELYIATKVKLFFSFKSCSTVPKQSRHIRNSSLKIGLQLAVAEST